MVNIIQTIKAAAYFAGAVLIVTMMNPIAQTVLTLFPNGIARSLSQVAYYLAVAFFVLILPYMIFTKIPDAT